MNIKIDNDIYEIIVEKKNNKNTYLRVKKDLKIYITTNYFVTNKYIQKLIDDNYSNIKEMIDNVKKKQTINNEIYYLGNKLDVVIINDLSNPYINNNRLLINNYKNIDNWYKYQAYEVFKDRLNICLNNFNEIIPSPNLKIRKMTSRWGVCNRSNNNVTLNLDLIKKDIDIIDYVIIHELCHFIHPNHSKKFWDLVNKYIPNYKNIRKRLKEH
jgi:predicted metal-dependent hydrolase